ncbi:MAG TPA: ribose-phosphate pyrophosphokinase [Nitrososphaerales archaeon]|nr:ribose-phosphate pyrophosphokinase [Nitrososphaerales archaeon]
MAKEWVVAAGPASLDLGASLSASLGAPLAKLTTIDFPDGESKIRIEGDLRNKSVIIVQSTYPPIDKHLLQLLLIAHKLSEEGAEVSAVIPYLCYARQDKEFLKGEIISLGVISHLMRSVGIKRAVTVDIHSVQGMGLFSFPMYSVSAIPLLAEYISSNYKLSNPIAVSPDLGSSNRVEAFAAVLNCEHIALKKTRDRITGEVKTEEKDLKLSGRDALIIDDMISTGGSVEKCAQLMKRHGAEKVIAACSHALLVGGAVERLEAAGVDDIIAANTIPSKYSRVDVTPLVASYFKTF